MKNDLDPYSYDALDSFYSSALGSYPPNVSQPAFPSNNVHSQPGSAFNVVQSNTNYVNNQSAFQSTGKYSYYTVTLQNLSLKFQNYCLFEMHFSHWNQRIGLVHGLFNCL